MRAPAVALVLLGLAAAPATAAQPECTVVTDAKGDVAVRGTPAVAAAVPDSHVDVTSGTIRWEGNALHVRVEAADLSQDRRGRWVMTFVSRGKTVLVRGGSDVWVNAGTTDGAYGFYAGVYGTPLKHVTGSFDYAANTVTVHVPAFALGKAAPAKGTVLTGFAVEATERFVHATGSEVTLTDTARSTTRYVVGSRC